MTDFMGHNLTGLPPDQEDSGCLSNEIHIVKPRSRRIVAGIVSLSSFFIRLTIHNLRVWIDHVAVPFARYFHFSHLAVDGKPCRQEVSLDCNISYGDLPCELMDIISPVNSAKKPGSKDSILYVHGGGFVSVHRGVLNHSMTPLARAGFTVYSIDYPLAPDHKYPNAIISVLKSLAHLKSCYGVTAINLLGDSAGGSLVSMAAGIIANPESDWDPAIKAVLRGHTFPEISGVALLYSICDEKSWEEQSDLSIMNFIVVCLLQLCLSLYRDTGQKVTVVDNMDKVKTYPPTFLLCGDGDVLQHSHEVFANELAAIDVPVESVITRGFHGYHGLPVPFSFGLWRTTVFPATCALIRWLTKGDESRVPKLPARSLAEYDIHLLVIIIALHALPFYVLWAAFTSL